MGKSLDIDWPTPDGHPAEDDLLLYVDGELGAKEAGNMRAHLEACWSCRVRTEKIQEAISSFIDYRNNVLKPLIDQPPQGWRSFGGKLSRMVAENGRRSFFSQLLGSLEKYFTPLRVSVSRGFLFRVAAGLLVAVTLTALIIYSNRVTTVSADALLQNAIDTQMKQLRANSQPVIHQKLQLKRRNTAVLTQDVVTVEIWNDTTNSRFRRAIDEGRGQRFISSESSPTIANPNYAESPSSLVELEKVLLANHMDPGRPLSPSSYQTWRKSVEPKQEEVIRSTRADGLEVLTLKTVPMGSVSVGGITEANLILRAYDWHPEQLRLRVRGEKEDQEFELTETVFNVVSLTALSLEIFSEPQQVASALVPSPAPAVKASRDPLLSSSLIAHPFVAANAELEVEVLRLLNQAGADLGEQVSAKRTEKGILEVTGIVETEQRKVDILRALEPVMNHQAVRIEIRTVAEALAQQQSPRMGSVLPPSTTQKVEIASDAVAAEAELRSYFAREGERADEVARQFAARTVSRARRAMRYVYALKRLSGQFSSQDLRGLSPEARSKWLALIRSHAGAYRAEAEGLRNDLQPIFFPRSPFGPGPDVAGEGGIDTTDDAQVLRAVNRLIELASANDRVIRSAFAASNETATITAIKTPQFWQSLRGAEHLAEKIARSQ